MPRLAQDLEHSDMKVAALTGFLYLVFFAAKSGTAADFLYAASGKAIFSLELQTGNTALISSNGLLSDIDDIAVGPDGSIYVGNGTPSRVIKVNPANGAQTLLTASPIGWNLAIEANEDVIAAASATISRWKVSSGAIEAVSANGLLTDIDDIALGPDGSIYVGNGSPSRIIKVNPVNGAQTLLTTSPIGWNLAIEANGDVIAAAGVTISRWKMTGGAIETVSANGLLTDIDDIALGQDGSIYVGNGTPSRIIKANPSNGAQTPLSTNPIGWNLGIPPRLQPPPAESIRCKRRTSSWISSKASNRRLPQGTLRKLETFTGTLGSHRPQIYSNGKTLLCSRW